MIISESIRAWVRGHNLQDTLLLMGSGEVIEFREEGFSTADSMAATVLTAAYIYFEVERERRSDIGKAVYFERARRGKYIPKDYFGFTPGTFIPSEKKRFVGEMFMEASRGAEADEIAEWLNDCELRTVKGNEFTPRAVRAILSNPVYCSDVVFHRAGRGVRDHHEGIVDRELWETVNGGRVTATIASEACLG